MASDSKPTAPEVLGTDENDAPEAAGWCGIHQEKNLSM